MLQHSMTNLLPAVQHQVGESAVLQGSCRLSRAPAAMQVLLHGTLVLGTEHHDQFWRFETSTAAGSCTVEPESTAVLLRSCICWLTKY
jgi:hypothetical protein